MAPRMVYLSMIYLLLEHFCRSEYDVSTRRLRAFITYWGHVCCLNKNAPIVSKSYLNKVKFICKNASSMWKCCTNQFVKINNTNYWFKKSIIKDYTRRFTQRMLHIMLHRIYKNCHQNTLNGTVTLHRILDCLITAYMWWRNELNSPPGSSSRPIRCQRHLVRQQRD